VPNGGAAGDLNATCKATTDCKNDNCTGYPTMECSPPCCKSADCTALGLTGFVCTYGETGSGRLKWCVEQPAGKAALGADCHDNFDCATQYCDVEQHKCMNVCCSDADCAKDEACRPNPVLQPLLRCVKRN
jgi:hypothetical protein